MLDISVISEPVDCVLLHFLGKSQSPQDSQLFLHGAPGWFTDASLDKLDLFLRTDAGQRGGRDCPLVPGARAGDSAGDTLPPPGGVGGRPPASSLLLLLAMDAALADVVAGVHLGLLLSTNTRVEGTTITRSRFSVSFSQ